MIGIGSLLIQFQSKDKVLKGKTMKRGGIGFQVLLTGEGGWGEGEGGFRISYGNVLEVLKH